MKTRTLRKTLSMLLTAAMILNIGFIPVFAVGTTIGASGLTECHTTHDETCGYSETATMGGCTHEHGDDCGYAEGTEEQPCTFIPDEDGEASPTNATEHTHDDTCGYAPAAEGTPCTHEHDESCGYRETITVTSPCTHSCEVCEPGDKPEEKICTCEPVIGASNVGHGKDCPLYTAPVCICPPVDSGELVHGKDCPLYLAPECICSPVDSGELIHGTICPLYTAPEISEAVKALIAMVDALPSVTDITEENKETTKIDVETAQTAYKALTNKDKAAFEATEQYEKLMELTAILTNSGEEPQELVCICPSEGGSSIHTESNCPFYGIGTPSKKQRSAGAVSNGDITVVKEVADFTWSIYANGNPIIIQKGQNDLNYSFIYIDANNNGIVDSDETPVELPGVYLADGHGYFLPNSTIYGGCETADVAGGTSVTINSGKVYMINGGCLNGNVNGDVTINASGGTIRYMHGAAYGNAGDVNINLFGDCIVSSGVFGGARNEGTVENTNIIVSDNAKLVYLYGGAEGGTTGDTSITVNGGKIQTVSGGGNGYLNPANSNNSTITINSNVFYRLDDTTESAGGWIYGGGFGLLTSTANSIINLNYDDDGEYNSLPMVCGAGNMGSITGNSIINVTEYSPSRIFCGGYSGNVAGTMNVNVSANDGNSNQYGIYGSRGDGQANVGGKRTVTYSNMGTANKPAWGSFVENVDTIILDKAFIIISGNSSQPFCDNLTVAADSSLSVWGESPLTVTKGFTGGGSIISEANGYLSVGGTVSGVTTLDFNKKVPSDNTEVKIVSAPNAAAENFKLADSRTDYTLINSSGAWKAVKSTAIPLDIKISGTPTYGNTIEVTVTATGSVSTAGQVTLTARSTELNKEVFTKTNTLNADKTATFSIALEQAAGNYSVKASFSEGAASGETQTALTVARLPLTISGIKIPAREYGANTSVKIPFSSFENATLTGYINGDTGAVLSENIYYAQLDISDLDAGENKPITFAPNEIFHISQSNDANRIMASKYYVPAPNNLTIDIIKQKYRDINAPIAKGSIAFGQTLADVQLQDVNPLLDTKWVDSTIKPQIGNQTGYPLICTFKSSYSKNYEFDTTAPAYDAQTGGLIKNVRVGVNAEVIHNDYFVNDGEKQETIDLSVLQPYGESIAASDVTLKLKAVNPTQNVSNVAFDEAAKRLSYTVANTSTAIKDMAVISFEVTAKDQPKTIFEVIISTVERPDLSSIDTAISGANSAKEGIITDERTESLVKKGTKFVTAAEMQALDDAIKTAETAKTTVNSTEQAQAAASVLDNAVAKFKAVIKTGTYVERPDLSSIDTAISGANSAKEGIITDERTESLVEKGTKFVTAAEMQALDDAIKTAEAAKTTVKTTAQAQAAASVLDNAVAKFKAVIKMGTYKKDDNSSSGGSGGGSGGSGGSSNVVVTTPTQDKPSAPTQGEVKVMPKVDTDNNATVTVSEKNVDDAIKKAQDEAKKNGTEKNGIAVTITLDTAKALNSFAANLPKVTQEKLIAAGVTTFTINGGATITFDLDAIKQIKTTANADVMVTAAKTASGSFSKEAQAATNGRPVYDFKVTGGGKSITTFGSGKLALSIPYELQKVDANGKPSKTGSTENPGNLVGAYVDANGKLTYLPGSSYNAKSKTMLINTNHLSVYGVAYRTNAPTFTDTASHWAKNDIQFVAARGLLTGTTATTFAPNGNMTRGMFVTALGRLANADVSGYKTSSFSDVAADSYYLGYVEWAVKNKIVKGVGDGKFAPEQSISRQEMAVMLQSYTKAIGYKLPSVHKEIVFTDSANMGAWAKSAVKEMQMAGILMGKDGGKFDPTGTATRGEVSAMLRRFVELVANSETAEGWVTNDSGNWMYFENGKAVKASADGSGGKKNIGGTNYEFDQYGVTALLPKNRRYTLYTVKKGDSFWAIASKYKVSLNWCRSTAKPFSAPFIRGMK